MHHLHPVEVMYRQWGSLYTTWFWSTFLYIGVAQVLLLSRDEMSMLTVSYADIARCLKTAYAELQARRSAVHR